MKVLAKEILATIWKIFDLHGTSHIPLFAKLQARLKKVFFLFYAVEIDL